MTACGARAMDDEEIEALVRERVRCREGRDYARADAIKRRLERQYDVILTDVARKHGGGTDWAYRTRFPETGTGAVRKTVAAIKRNAASRVDDGSLVAKLKVLVKQDSMVSLLKDRELQGRQHADLAFDMALAGVGDGELFSLLARGAMSELERCGARNSMRGMDIVMLCERFAAAGVRDESLYELAAQKIEIKLEKLSVEVKRASDVDDPDSNTQTAMLNSAVARLRSGTFELMDDRALALLWRHSARQHKSGRQMSLVVGTVRRSKVTRIAPNSSANEPRVSSWTQACRW